MNQRKIIFFHLPKTAGTSVKRALLNAFGEDKVALIYGKPFFEEKMQAFMNSNMPLAIGHMPWKEDYSIAIQDYVKITFLRHPVDRTVSHYLHVKYSQSKEHDVFKNVSFLDFLKTNAGSNDMTRRLGGGFYKENKNSAHFFKAAAENISHRFDFVGLQENLTREWQRLSAFLKMDLGELKTFNKSEHKAEAKQLKEAYEDQIIEANKLDLDLYKLAQKRV